MPDQFAKELMGDLGATSIGLVFEDPWIGDDDRERGTPRHDPTA